MIEAAGTNRTRVAGKEVLAVRADLAGRRDGKPGYGVDGTSFKTSQAVPLAPESPRIVSGAPRTRHDSGRGNVTSECSRRRGRPPGLSKTWYRAGRKVEVGERVWRSSAARKRGSSKMRSPPNSCSDSSGRAELRGLSDLEAP